MKIYETSIKNLQREADANLILELARLGEQEFDRIDLDDAVLTPYVKGRINVFRCNKSCPYSLLCRFMNFKKKCMTDNFDIQSNGLLYIPERMPFPVPDPVMEYQRNQYEDFDLYRRDIIIPEMLIKLRQWFGRGIRREKDTAVFSILDSRASLRGRYRAEILNTLPTMPVTDRLMDVADFIIRKKADSYFMDKEWEEE